MSALAIAALILLQQEAPPERPKFGKPDRKEEVEVDARAGVELFYDSNVTMLSDRDIDELEDDLRPDKFRIEQPDDFVTSPWIEAALKARLIGDPTTLGLRAQAYFYAVNGVKDHQEITLFARQKLGAHDALEFEYEFTPEFYKREYRIPPSGVFDSAFYAQHDFQLTWRHRFSEIVSFRPQGSWRFRDYESPFHFRDSTSYVVGARLDVSPVEVLELRLAYEYENLDAKGTSAEPDLSHVEHAIEPAVVVIPTPGLEFSLKYRAAAREYTTSNDPLVDPGHVDREDRIGRIAFEVAWKINRHWELDWSFLHTRQESDRPFDAGASDEETSFARNVILAGITWRM